MKGTVTAVCRAPAKGMQKSDVGEALLVKGKGMEGDAHFGFQDRQVSLLNPRKPKKSERKCRA